MKISLDTMPVSTNRLYMGGKILSRKGRINKDAIGWEARAQIHGEPLPGPLKVSIELWWPDNRNHDIDNIKGLFDALTGIAWEDDRQIMELHVVKGVDKENPRCDIEIQKLST